MLSTLKGLSKFEFYFYSFLGLFALGLAGFIIFWPLPFQSDDYWVLYSTYKRPVTFLNSWVFGNAEMYRPMAILFLFLELKIFGFQPGYFYATHYLLHLINTFLVWRYMQMIPREKFSVQSRLAVIVALFYFFARFQSLTNVFWISAITDLLCFTFGILGLMTLASSRGNSLTKIVCWFFMLLSILTKETGILFVYFGLFFLWAVHREKKERIVLSIHLLSVVGIYALLRFAALGGNFYNANTENILLFKWGFWVNMIPALFAPFDMNDINYIRWSGNDLLYWLLLPLLPMGLLILVSFRDLQREKKLAALLIMFLLNFSSMFLYTTYHPGSRLVYINGLPLVFAVALMADSAGDKIRKFFSVLMVVIILLGNISEIWYQIQIPEFQNNLKKVMSTFDVNKEPLIIIPYHLTSHQKYRVVPLYYSTVFWSKGVVDTVQGRLLFPVKSMDNSLSTAGFDYEIRIVDSAALEINSRSLLAKYIYTPYKGNGRGIDQLYNELIDSVAILDEGKPSKKGREARIYFNYEGVVRHNPPVLFVRDREMKIERLSDILGIKIPAK